MSAGSALIMCRSIAPIAPNLRDGRNAFQKLGISHDGIVDAPYGSGLSFRDPDNNALEFFARSRLASRLLVGPLTHEQVRAAAANLRARAKLDGLIELN